MPPRRKCNRSNVYNVRDGERSASSITTNDVTSANRLATRQKAVNSTSQVVPTVLALTHPTPAQAPTWLALSVSITTEKMAHHSQSSTPHEISHANVCMKQ
ncbi:hypothetical protein AVEN_193080-1 [Araneus ventricosus]|uniref:Uncharacterized protein n=1 Tax=Araneus ventricosus TaxID=182803 RepID=A0A4Y2B0G6_ARAVE|nr:hypothetical protein AVEN_193080-1 [Araneus ventricosus]